MLYPCVTGEASRAAPIPWARWRSSSGPPSAPASGIEVELTLVDPESGALVSAASGDPRGARSRPSRRRAPEGQARAVRVHASRSSPASARPRPRPRRDLAATIAEVRGAAATTRARRCSRPGSHPFSLPHEQIVSPDPRYAALIEEMQWTARRLQIFGIHYHVGVRSAEKSIVDRERAAVLPRAPARAVGVEPVLGGSRHRARVVPGEGVRGPADRGAAAGHRGLGRLRAVHAHARRRPRRSRRSARCGGTCARTRTSGRSSCASATRCRRCARSRAVGALVQCLVHRIDTQIDAGEPVYIPREWTIRQNKWLAARYGLDAKLIVDDEGTRATARDVDRSTCIDELAPIAAELGCVDELADVAHILELGPSYLRQRAVVAGRRRACVDVVHSLVDELESDEPGAPVSRRRRRRSTTELDAFLDGHLEELIAFRRELHAHPELSGEEHETTARVAERLRVAGLEPAGPARPAPAYLRPPRRRGRSGPVGSRCAPTSTRWRWTTRPRSPYRSQVPGRRARVRPRRAHDRRARRRPRAHPAPRRRRRTGGSVPAACSSRPRSPRRGGARRRDRRGRARRTSTGSSACTATRSSTRARSGCASARSPRPRTSSTIRLHGPGGHTARPHLTVDLVAVAGRLAAELPGRAARELDPSLNLVFGALHAGDAANVIPATAHAAGHAAHAGPRRVGRRARPARGRAARAASSRPARPTSSTTSAASRRS